MIDRGGDSSMLAGKVAPVKHLFLMSIHDLKHLRTVHVVLLFVFFSTNGLHISFDVMA